MARVTGKQTIEILSAENYLIDWLIVDHYSLDAQWETSMRSYDTKFMVIDDMANRKHDCDLYLIKISIWIWKAAIIIYRHSSANNY